MDNDTLYSVLVVRGDIFELNDVYNDVIRYGDLDRAEATDIAEKSIERGYTVAIWKQDAEHEDSGGEAQKDE